MIHNHVKRKFKNKKFNLVILIILIYLIKHVEEYIRNEIVSICMIPDRIITSFYEESLEFSMPDKTWEERGFQVVPTIQPLLIENHKVCQPSDDNTQVLIVINSAVERLNYRIRVRSTWGNTQYNVNNNIKLLFVLGNDMESHLNPFIRVEYETYGDILQVSTPDGYDDLTYRGIQVLRWISENCQSVPYIIKTDDDCMVNVFAVLDELNKPQPFGFSYEHINNSNEEKTPVTEYIGCGLLWKDYLITRCGKNGVPWEEYPHRSLPPFCPGGGYVITYNTSVRLYRSSINAPFLRNDDVFMTGILPQIDGHIKLKTIPGYTFLNSKKKTLDLTPEEADTKEFLDSYMFLHINSGRKQEDKNMYMTIWNSYVKHYSVK